MQEHLDQGCESCKKTVEMFSALVEFAKEEVAYRPPPDALRIAESYFIPQKLAFRETPGLQLARLTFDSIEHHALQGVRGFDQAARQLMYQCGEVFVDMRFEPKSASNWVTVTGQLVDSRLPEGGVAGITVSLLSRHNSLLSTTTNQLGEFRFFYQEVDRLRVLIELADSTLLVLLPDAESEGA